MSKPVPKLAYLAELQARVDHNRRIVQTVFVPLGQDERGWQPAPGEWSVDQCYQHLILSFQHWLPDIEEALGKPERPDAAGLFRQSWWGRRLMGRIYEPKRKLKTKNQFVPENTSYPDVFSRFRQQLDRLSAMIEQAAQADLQTMVWFHKEVLSRLNLGEHLAGFVAHDELHIDQARRALEAYERQAEAAVA
jgi:hypothetical protein